MTDSKDIIGTVIHLLEKNMPKQHGDACIPDKTCECDFALTKELLGRLDSAPPSIGFVTMPEEGEAHDPEQKAQKDLVVDFLRTREEMLHTEYMLISDFINYLHELSSNNSKQT